MSQELFDVYPAVFVGASTLNIQQLDTVEPDPQIEEMLITGGGSVDALMYATATCDPRVKIASRDVQTILATVSALAGFDVSTSSKLQYRKQDSGTDFATGNVHLNLSSPKGFLYVEDYGAKQGDKEGADINLTYVPLFNGVTAPLTCNLLQGLTSTVGLNSLHHLGPQYIEGVELGGVQSVRYKSGIEIETKASDGLVWPTTCRIKLRKPTIEIEAHNLSILNTLGMNGTYPITTGFVGYLLRVLKGSGRYAANTANHIATSASDGVYKVTGVTGSKRESAMAKITIMPSLQANGSHSFAVATASAIA